MRIVLISIAVQRIMIIRRWAKLLWSILHPKGERGRVFGSNASRGGGLYVCAVPSLTPDGNITMQCERTNQTSMSNGMISTGQFVSGGSDGRLVVWDFVPPCF